MGKTENEWSSTESEGNHLSGGAQENCCRSTRTVGEGEGCEEDCLGPAEPAANT
jgi:hypothetical protein